MERLIIDISLLAAMQKSGKKPEIILHVGMHKTGTTFFQWNVFHYLDVNYLWHVFYRSWCRDLLDPTKKIDTKKIKENFSKILHADKINLITEENIYTSQFAKKDNRFLLLDRIKEVFPVAKIIFGTRNKDENLVSWYIEYVAVGGVLDFQGFLEHNMNIEKLNYEPYIKKLIEYYGKENIFVYSLEELRQNQKDVVKRMCNFINVDVPKKYREKPARVGYGLTVLRVSLYLNRFFKTTLNKKGIIPWWGPILPQNILFHSFIMKYIKQKKITLDDLKKLKIDF